MVLSCLALALAACGGATESPGATAAPSVAPVTPTPDLIAPTTTPPGPTSWVMPDLVGENLQDAQNAIQSLTDFAIAVTTSSDATGAGREQILDRNWRVCAQSVAAGETITADTEIDFATVKLEESC